MKRCLLLAAVSLVAFASQARVPDIFLVPSSQQTGDSFSNVDRLSQLSRYLVSQDFRVSWVVPGRVEMGAILSVKMSRLVEDERAPEIKDVWVPYRISLNQFTQKDGHYFLTLPVNLEISYRKGYLCGEEVEGVGSIQVSLPRDSREELVEAKSYAVDINDLEKFDARSPELVPVLSSCFD